MIGSNKREFRQKLGFLLIDKLLVGGFVLLVGYYIQMSQGEKDRRAAERERLRDISLVVSRVFTDVVYVDRKIVFTSVRNLLALLNELESDGKVTESNDREKLKVIVENIENALTRLTRLTRVEFDQLDKASDLTEQADNFVRQIRSIRSDLLHRRRDKSALQEDAGRLVESYMRLLGELREISIIALEADRKAVEEVLSRESTTGGA